MKRPEPKRLEISLTIHAIDRIREEAERRNVPVDVIQMELVRHMRDKDYIPPDDLDPDDDVAAVGQEVEHLAMRYLPLSRGELT
jgi:hypothetical protein